LDGSVQGAQCMARIGAIESVGAISRYLDYIDDDGM
jgi:hypothetical protein